MLKNIFIAFILIISMGVQSLPLAAWEGRNLPNPQMEEAASVESVTPPSPEEATQLIKSLQDMSLVPYKEEGYAKKAVEFFSLPSIVLPGLFGALSYLTFSAPSPFSLALGACLLASSIGCFSSFNYLCSKEKQIQKKAIETLFTSLKKNPLYKTYKRDVKRIKKNTLNMLTPYLGYSIFQRHKEWMGIQLEINHLKENIPIKANEEYKKREREETIKILETLKEEIKRIPVEFKNQGSTRKWRFFKDLCLLGVFDAGFVAGSISAFSLLPQPHHGKTIGLAASGCFLLNSFLFDSLYNMRMNTMPPLHSSYELIRKIPSLQDPFLLKSVGQILKGMDHYKTLDTLKTNKSSQPQVLKTIDIFLSRVILTLKNQRGDV
jgi:hypothetical protein